MSSFKRRTQSKQVELAPGTRLSPSSASVITSTGIASLDDILGGGLPLQCLFTVLAPDNHSAYGELVQKYFIAQGLAAGHTVWVVHEESDAFVQECMWTGSSPLSTLPNSRAGNEEDQPNQVDDKIRIAWRYEQMKTFQTTVSSPNSASDDYCATFDLSCRISKDVISTAQSSEKLQCIGVDYAPNTMDVVIQKLQEILKASDATQPIRLCIPSLGSPAWGDISSSNLLYFLSRLRSLLKQHPKACASLSLAPHTSSDKWGGGGWVQKVAWCSDAAITMSAFGADTHLTSLFPSQHGFVQIHRVPAPNTLLPASDKLSILRGLSSAAGASAGSGENNLAFKCTRKRLVFETMHLDLEGGVSERRTTPS
ncbi:PAXNEB-domain-containing protein, partial [Coniophora puteana RWD-64-598 SS2]